jgi:hypothetical protein
LSKASLRNIETEPRKMDVTSDMNGDNKLKRGQAGASVGKNILGTGNSVCKDCEAGGGGKRLG